MESIRDRTLAVTGKAVPQAAVKVTVNGEEVVIDPMTFTGRERQRMRSVLAKLDYEADGGDVMFASIWVVLARTDPTVTFDDVLDSVTMADIAGADTANVEDDLSPEV